MIKTSNIISRINKIAEENKTLTAQLNEKTKEVANWKAKFDDKVEASEEYERTTKAKIAELENKYPPLS